MQCMPCQRAFCFFAFCFFAFCYFCPKSGFPDLVDAKPLGTNKRVVDSANNWKQLNVFRRRMENNLTVLNSEKFKNKLGILRSPKKSAPLSSPSQLSQCNLRTSFCSPQRRHPPSVNIVV